MTNGMRFKSDMIRGTIWMIALAALLGGCKEGTLDLQVVVPETPDPFEGVSQLRLTVSAPSASKVIEVSDAKSFDLELTVEIDGEVGTIGLEGFAGKEVLARGETPPLVLRAIDDKLNILVGRAGELSRLETRLDAAGGGMVAALMPSLGVLLAGGSDRDGKPLATATVYDFFDHVLLQTDPLPSPRSGALGASCGGSCAMVVLGEAASGALADEMLRLDGMWWRSIPDGLASEQRRRDAALALLADGTYLIVGGAGRGGALVSSMLQLDPGTNGTPTLMVLPTTIRAGRRRPAVAASASAVLIAGGQQDGDPAAELFTLAANKTEIMELQGPSLAGETAAASLPDGTIVLLGGRDGQGQPLRDGWIIDPVDGTALHREDVLESPRAGHSLVLVEGQLLVVGGQDDAGLAPAAEVLAADSLARLRQPAMQVPRQGQSIARMGRGSLLVFGGVTDDGAPTDILELYESF